MSNSELKASLIDYANGLMELGDNTNCDLIYKAIDLIEDLEDENFRLSTENDQLQWGYRGEDEF